MRSNRSKLPFLEFAFILFYTYICLNPNMNVAISMVQFLFMHLIYTFYLIFKDKKIYRTSVKLLCASFVIALMYVATTSMVFIDNNASNRYIKGFLTMMNNYYGLIFPVFLFYRIAVCASQKQKWILLILSVAVLVVVMKTTMVELQINERILKSRMMASLSDDNSLVGGYTFVCAAPILASGCFYAFLLCRNNIMRWCMLLCTLLLLYFLIKSMYSIALLSAVLGICFCFYVRSSADMKKLYIVAPLITWLIAPYLLDHFIGFLDDGDTKLRMIELRDFFMSGDFGDEDLGARMEFYRRGIMAFFQSPIWGNYHLGFNSHSTIIEILASTGIIGGYSLFVLLRQAFIILKVLNRNYSILPICSTFLFMAMTNPVHSSPPLNISLWLIVPLLYSLIPINRNYEISI